MKNILKNVNTTDDLDEIYDYPIHLPYRFNLNKNNEVRDSWEDKWDNNHKHDKYWQQCKRIDALLEKSIGKPFDEVYSKVCSEYPKMICWGESLKDYFNKQFRQPKYGGGYYWIDNNGLIQYENYTRRVKHRGIIRRNIDKDPEYRVNHDEIQNYTSLMNTIYYNMGKEAYYRLLDSDVISEKFYNDIKRATNYDSNVNNIIDKMVWKLTYDKNLHKSEYKRVKAEDDDYKKKLKREKDKLNEKYKENLLKYVEWKRKQPETDDIIERDRLGFDDKSFKNC